MKRSPALLLLLLCPIAFAQNYTPTKYVAWLTSSDGGNTFQPETSVLSGSPNYTPTEYAAILCQSAAGQPYQLCSASGGGGSGTVTSIATTGPITGGTITTTGTIACATCVVASSPGVGIAHFAGSTQTVTSSAVSLTGDVTGILPVGNGGTGTATPGLVAGTNVTITGTWPNQTINASGGGAVLLSPAGNQTVTQATSSTTPLTVSYINNISAAGFAATNASLGTGILLGGANTFGGNNHAAIYMNDATSDYIYGAGVLTINGGWGIQNDLYLEASSFGNGALSGELGNVWITAGVPGSSGGTPKGNTVMIADAFLSSTGTQLTNGNIVCVGGGTSTYDVQNCPTSSANAIGVSVAPKDGATGVATTYVLSHGITTVNLDASSTVAVGDNICTSTTTAGDGHANSTTACSTQRIGIVVAGGTSVTTAGVVLKIQ